MKAIDKYRQEFLTKSPYGATSSNLRPLKKTPAAPSEGMLWAEANIQRRENLLVGVSGGQVSRTGADSQDAVYVRASAGKAGYAYTQDLAADAGEMLRQAAANGEACDTERPNVLGSSRVEPAGPLPQAATLANLQDVAGRLEALTLEAGRSAGVVRASAEIRMDTRSAWTGNTQGLDVSSARRVYAAQVSVLAEHAGRQYNADAETTAESLDGLDLEAAAARAIWQAQQQYAQGDLKPGQYPVVLDSSVVINIFTTAWAIFSAAKYLDGSSVLAGRLGEAIGNSALSVSDRVRRDGCGYVFASDDEGCPGRDALLVDKGRLTGLMQTQATAARLNVTPTGNSGRVATLTGSIPTELIVVPKVFCVEPGARSQADLLAAMGHGVLISRSFDVFHSVNAGSGDFAIPCSGAVVEDGQIVRAVGGLTICGNLMDLFATVEDAGNDLWIEEFLLHSYCIGGPSLRLSKLQVNGRG